MLLSPLAVFILLPVYWQLFGFFWRARHLPVQERGARHRENPTDRKSVV